MGDAAPTRTLVRSAVATALVAIVLVLGGHAGAASADAGVQIDVIDDAPSPSPSASSSVPAPSGSSGGPTSPGGSGGASSSVPSGGASEAPSPTTSVPGVRMPFVVSALTAIPSSSFAPFGARVDLELTVHNLTGEPVDATADLRLENVFGARLAERAVAIADLQPGERRLVRVEFDALGQEGLVKAVAVVTPPEAVDGQDMAPVQREVWTFITPWIVVAGCLVLGAGVGVPFLLRRWRVR